LPRFFVFLGVGVEILVVFLEFAILVKLFIFKDFVVFVVEVRAGIHAPARNVIRQRVWRPLEARQRLRLVGKGTLSNNAARNAGKPRIDLAARVRPAPDL
jgi:hypothetical protein